MLTRYFIYGLIGLCMEVAWTGFTSFLKRDYKLTAQTSLWMFWIYGLAVFLEPFSNFLSESPVLLRGGVYAILIFIAEYITGWLLRKIDVCPWDYSHCKYNIKGLIRLDYAPLWFFAGLLFEYVGRFYI